ncbi:MAG: hypothetical protein CHACPFDD_03523 [Phycisphaerae bacterium]|nr:hypothetical protein [Phycisphaerae bacterium]
MGNLLSVALGVACLVGPKNELVYDSGNPVPGAGDEVMLASVWRVLDPLDNLSVNVVRPFELSEATAVSAFSFYAFNPKDPATKVVDLYVGTNTETPGTLLYSFDFTDHSGTREGWTTLILEQPVFLEAGSYGVSFRGHFEFQSYWAVGAPNGPGYAWVRLRDSADWVRATREDYGFVPNFALRVYSSYDLSNTSGELVRPNEMTRVRGMRVKARADQDGGKQVEAYEYQPGQRPALMHTIRRPFKK